jgi:hypothetical protein
MERPIDFSRERHMLCGQCGRQWVVDLDWIDRWSGVHAPAARSVLGS